MSEQCSSVATARAGNSSLGQLYLGMPMWSHAQWRQSVYRGVSKPAERLARYAQVFSTVEGNTTFYATPSAATVADWRAAVDDDFRFTFKFPQTITHQQQLRQCQRETAEFLRRMAPLADVTGQWLIQLPKTFGPEGLPALTAFLSALPTDMTVAVEVRNSDFFAKGAAEQQLNRALVEHRVNRVMMDSRPLFSAHTDDDVVLAAQRKKPQLPVHVIATAKQPMVRYIGHPALTHNEPFFQPWMKKLAQWLQEGKSPYLFIHTPDNAEAPVLAKFLLNQLTAYMGTVPVVRPLNIAADEHGDDEQLGWSF